MSNAKRPSPHGESLEEQLRAVRQRSARLAAELVLERDKVRQLQDGYDRKDNQAWHQEMTIDTLKRELHQIGTLAQHLQHHILAQQTTQPEAPALGQEGTPAAPVALSAAAEEAQMALKLALLDLEDRLQDAVSLVLDELNTRKAAEARIRELEAQLAAVRRRIGSAG
jgi:hypothetical protein